MVFTLSSLRVLVVDDSSHVRLLMAEILYTIGIQRDRIFEAADGLAALELLSAERIDLVITDWRMEPMDGLTFVQKLRDPENSTNSKLPVILCSGYTDQNLIERARDVGINEIVAKPINIKSVESRIRAVLEQPRPFVEEAVYFGPDRRRRDGTRKDGTERRSAKS